MVTTASMFSQILALFDRVEKINPCFANEHRPREVYEDVFYGLLGKCHALVKAKKRKFRFKNKLYSFLIHAPCMNYLKMQI